MTCELTFGEAKLLLLQGDITLQTTDAIVNAANSSLMGGGGVDGAIHRAGGPAILEECKKIISKIGRLDVGHAVITTGGRLKTKYVIHTVGPVWHGGHYEEEALLSSCYVECLKLATGYKLSSISFPSISTGAYGYPVSEASIVSLKAILSYLKANKTFLKEIVLVLFDSRTFAAYQTSLNSIDIKK